MKTFRNIVLLALVALAWSSDPASAQNYNYRIGDTRVQAGHNGLAGQPGTYITGGTLSRSAQAAVLPMPPQVTGQQGGACGITPGTTANAMGLQSARMGSTVGMAGDYMRSDLNPNWNITRPQQQQQQQMRGQQNPYLVRQPVLNRPTNYTTYGSATGQRTYQSTTVPVNNNNYSGSSYKGY
ncbi:MAG: hypothetical protein LCH63_12370 [Candidatus Melainabacteria bacterium]|uniref:Uncharacterized protein n=1 Tax=Candidatus Obscuribacter phosphatis TaxID=1906157 RepID=A0A8J7TKJ9_9BACT|nr:hypothetical protein [Candidatus Obscuribacter phosphatis]MCA0314612.1 hypothetical protein [Candidatus Melainabacteria bacterium]